MKYFFDQQHGGNAMQGDNKRTQDGVRADQQTKKGEITVNNPYYQDEDVAQQEGKTSSNETKSEKAQSQEG